MECAAKSCQFISIFDGVASIAPIKDKPSSVQPPVEEQRIGMTEPFHEGRDCERLVLLQHQVEPFWKEVVQQDSDRIEFLALDEQALEGFVIDFLLEQISAVDGPVVSVENEIRSDEMLAVSGHSRLKEGGGFYSIYNGEAIFTKCQANIRYRPDTCLTPV